MHEASQAYAQALNLCHNERERAFLKRRLAEVSSSTSTEEL
jgi:predicted RNA polymerase sigma factor